MSFMLSYDRPWQMNMKLLSRSAQFNSLMQYSLLQKFGLIRKIVKSTLFMMASNDVSKLQPVKNLDPGALVHNISSGESFVERVIISRKAVANLWSIDEWLINIFL